MTVTLHLDETIPYIITDECGTQPNLFGEELKLCAFAQGIIDLNKFCGVESSVGKIDIYRKILNIIEDSYKK